MIYINSNMINSATDMMRLMRNQGKEYPLHVRIEYANEDDGSEGVWLAISKEEGMLSFEHYTPEEWSSRKPS